MLNWLCIDSTREGELTVIFEGGLTLVVLLGAGVAELCYRQRLLRVLQVGQA